MLDRYLQDALEKLKRGEFGKTTSGEASSNGKGGKGGAGSAALVDSPVDTLRLELEEQKELATNRLSELELLQSNYEKGLREVTAIYGCLMNWCFRVNPNVLDGYVLHFFYSFSRLNWIIDVS